jgi:hypothetical protein
MKNKVEYLKGKNYKGKGKYIGERITHSTPDHETIKHEHLFGTGKYDDNGAQILHRESVHNS